MQQAKTFFEHVQQNGYGAVFFRVIGIAEGQLGTFNIPIAKVVPKIFIYGLRAFVVTVIFKRGTRRGNRRIQAPVNPPVQFG